MVHDYADPETARRVRAATLHGIYALVDPARRAPLSFVEDLLHGGIRLFQIRAKTGIARDLLSAIVMTVRAAGGLTLVNDDVNAAGDADGLHLGQEDAALHDLRAVRARLAGAIIGLSCGTPAEARAVDPELIDYLGVGPLRATGSKPDAGLPIGVNGVRAVVAATNLPTAAIGGITLAGIPRVRETGATMAAIISALGDAQDARKSAEAFVEAWRSSRTFC